MVSRYSIIQYVPDPIADERINIGVVVFNEDAVQTRFLTNWERVRLFGMEDIDFLKDFADRVQKAALDDLLFPGEEHSKIPNHERLRAIAQGWINSIQFTEPRGSLDTLDSLLEDTVNTYLREPLVESKPKTRDRQAAATVVKSKTREVLKKTIEQHQNAYEKTTATYKQLGADVVDENEIEPWVSRQLEYVTV